MVSVLKELKACRDNSSIQKDLEFNVIDMMMMIFLKGHENMKKGFYTRKRNPSERNI